MYADQMISRQIGYTVREIATPDSRVKYWTPVSNEAEMLKLAEDNGYTYFPVKDRNRITGVLKVSDLKAGKRSITKLTSDWLIAADTPILHLLELFAKDTERILFVLGSSQVIGIVSAADLNQIPARASLYLLVAHYETLLTNLIQQAIGETDESLKRYLPETRIKNALKIRDEEQHKNLELPLIRYVTLFDLVECIKKHDDLLHSLGFKTSSPADVLKFNTVRNAVAHQNKLLIKTKDDIKKINDDCGKMIEYCTKLSELLNDKNGEG